MGISSVSDIQPAANSAHLILLQATLFEAFPPLLWMKKVQLNWTVMHIRWYRVLHWLQPLIVAHRWRFKYYIYNREKIYVCIPYFFYSFEDCYVPVCRIWVPVTLHAVETFPVYLGVMRTRPWKILIWTENYLQDNTYCLIARTAGLPAFLPTATI